jgi:hypothetical protein
MKNQFLSLVLIIIAISSCKKNGITEPSVPPTNTSYYYPPTGSDTWETTDAASLGWDVAKLNEAIAYAQSKNTYGLIILHKGKIVTENYWNGWDMNTKYLIASAGKSVTAFLTGIAQQGKGWTTCPPAKEDLITVRHQLTMTTGLEYNVPDENCATASCLTYKADAGTQWYYHNAPYRLLQDVIANASGTNYNLYTKTKLADKIGMKNYTWLNYILWLNTRDMARFGLLTLGKGKWDTQKLMTDTAYFSAMTNTSNSYNKSYGYLWWLNGKQSIMTPTSTQVYPVSLSASAPADMIAALGKGDKKIYVIPGLDLVVVRHGDDTGDAVLGPSSFDEYFWAKLKSAIKY